MKEAFHAVNKSKYKGKQTVARLSKCMAKKPLASTSGPCWSWVLWLLLSARLQPLKVLYHKQTTQGKTNYT